MPNFAGQLCDIVKANILFLPYLWILLFPVTMHLLNPCIMITLLTMLVATHGHDRS